MMIQRARRIDSIIDAVGNTPLLRLRNVAREFLNSDVRLACLQAQLTAYNPNENWLTRQFTAEYATLFGLILPALAARRLQIAAPGEADRQRR